MSASRTLLTATAVVFLLPFTSCSDDNNRSSAPRTSFFGTYADQAGNAGTVELVDVSPPPSFGSVMGQDEGTALDGELRIGGQTAIPLRGIFNSPSGTIAFASDDSTFNFNGAVAAGQGTGFGFGPGGPATFVIFQGGTPNSVDVFCGTVTCTSPPGCEAEGGFNLVVDGGEALTTARVDGAVGVGAGTVTGSDVSLEVAQVDVTVQGDISGTTVSGTWTDETNDTSGTWTGSTTQCQAARRP
jgi:hypothetical protein